MSATINGIYWDYGPDDKIKYFDASKSYYITGYRPINETEGLDFDPDWFREDAINKQKSGRYSPSSIPMFSRSHRNWWLERQRRCIEGFESHGYTITGDHYFFLNFYSLKSSEIGETNQQYGFPEFLVFQYEYFHYLSLCAKLDLDAAVLKSRGIGFSEIIASCAVNAYTNIANFRTVVSAFSDNHLAPTLAKIWLQLDWLNENTETAFRRVRMVINTKTHKRASKRNKDGQESGHRSEIEGIIVDDPDKLRGDRTQLLIYEEAGANPSLMKSWIKGTALITVLGGKRVGRKVAFGTGGSSKSGSMEGLSDLINNPVAGGVLPVKHNYTATRESIITGMFIPAYRIVYSKIDKRGYCKESDAIEYYNKERAAFTNGKNLLDYEAEYCFTIEEALIQKDSEYFPRDELVEQLTQINIFKSVPSPKRGSLVWKRNANDEPDGVKWKYDDKGKIQIFEHPLISPEGTSYRNLYVAGIDSIDIGVDDSAGTDKSPSDFCIVIKKRAFGMNDPMYVAMYKERPRDIREAYDIAAKMLTYYGCQAVLESTRTALLTHYRNNKFMHLLMKRPRATMTDITKSNSNMYGAPASVKTIEHYRELIYDFVLDYSRTIAYPEIVSQLLDYTDENKRKFDIVAAMGRQTCPVMW